MRPEVFVGGGDCFGFAIGGDFAVFNQDGAVAELTNVFHGVGDENDGLVAVEAGEIVVTFFLEFGVADGENFVEDEDITARTDSNRKGETNLHTRGIVFKLGIHEGFKLGKTDDFVIHGSHFTIGKTEKGAV